MAGLISIEHLHVHADPDDDVLLSRVLRTQHRILARLDRLEELLVASPEERAKILEAARKLDQAQRDLADAAAGAPSVPGV